MKDIVAIPSPNGDIKAVAERIGQDQVPIEEVVRSTAFYAFFPTVLREMLAK